MRRFASDVEAARGVEVGLGSGSRSPAHRLGPDFRRHVYLIFKEAVSNAARHSGCRKSGGPRRRTPRPRFLLRIKDDGTGFDAASATEGYGLTTMSRRARELGGRLEIASRPGGGTALTAELPFAVPWKRPWS